MKLSISNIAWTADKDEDMYAFLSKSGFSGLEIAPTRIFPQNPYDDIPAAKKYADNMKEKYNIEISSMQSIWFGITENIFGSENDRSRLVNYTKKAVDFAKAVNCKNLVFGCPKNRNKPDDAAVSIACDFFSEVGRYAENNNTVIALEPNPPYYNTNFINKTTEAFDFVKKINCGGLLVNVDLGTCINYNESIELLSENIDLINHIHISEPMLAPIEKRDIHAKLKTLAYNKYFSIEMKNMDDLNLVKQTVTYIKEILA